MANCCLTLFLAILATIGLSLANFSNYYCQTVKYEPEENAAGSLLPTVYFGIFTYSKISVELDLETLAQAIDAETQSTGKDSYFDEQECVQYNKAETEMEVIDNVFGSDDPFWKTAGACSIAISILGPITVLSLWISICCECSNNGWTIIAFIFTIILPGLQAATFFIMKSDLCTNDENPILQLLGLLNLYKDGCQLAFGGYTSLASIGVWVLTGAIMCVCK